MAGITDTANCTFFGDTRSPGVCLIQHRNPVAKGQTEPGYAVALDYRWYDAEERKAKMAEIAGLHAARRRSGTIVEHELQLHAWPKQILVSAQLQVHVDEFVPERRSHLALSFWLRIGNRGGRRSSPAKKDVNRESLNPSIKTQAGGVDLKKT
jgi:hypothetical protein